MMKEYKWLLKSSLTRDWERKYTGAYQELEQAKSRIQALDVWNCEREYEDTNVTHWMPLPTLPFIKWLNAN